VRLSLEQAAVSPAELAELLEKYTTAGFDLAPKTKPQVLRAVTKLYAAYGDHPEIGPLLDHFEALVINYGKK